MERSRWRHRLLTDGKEPDARFTLANERTFLAWIRTSLALLAGGVAVEAFAESIFPLEIRKILSISLLSMAKFISATACVRWLNIERAMRHNGPLPFPLLIPLLSIGGTLVTLVLITHIALRG
jgi:putative membrane protein